MDRNTKNRAALLFERYPELKKAYDLSLGLGQVFKVCTSMKQAFKRLALWSNEVEATGTEAFETVSRSIQSHYLSILNFFINRSCDASAESYNAKIKAFRATSRGVRDINFFLLRLSKIYA
jgi:transposase